MNTVKKIYTPGNTDSYAHGEKPERSCRVPPTQKSFEHRPNMEELLKLYPGLKPESTGLANLYYLWNNCKTPS